MLKRIITKRVKQYPRQETNPCHRYGSPTFYQMNQLKRYPASQFCLSYIGKTITTAQDGIYFREPPTPGKHEATENTTSMNRTIKFLTLITYDSEICQTEYCFELFSWKNVVALFLLTWLDFRLGYVFTLLSNCFLS